MIAHPPDKAAPIGIEPAAEWYRSLLGRLACMGNDDEPLRAVGLTSSRTSEGVSTVSANLALAAADHSGSQRVLLIDANPTLPALQRFFGADLSAGLGDVLTASLTLEEAIQPSNAPNLQLLPAGTIPLRELTGPELAKLAELMTTLRQRFDFVVVDLPPVSQAGVTSPIAGLLDGVLLVVEAERVHRQVARRTTEILAQSQARLLGAVLNKRRDHIPGWLYERL